MPKIPQSSPKKIMLAHGDRLLGASILSLQTGAELARVESLIIDPYNLQIIGFYVTGTTLDFSPALLMTEDIREVADVGIIINSSDDFISPDDLVTRRSIVDLRFNPVGMKVVDTQKRKLGKVGYFSVNMASFYIHQLHVTPTLWQSLQHAEFIVHRHQIVNISDNTITVQAPTATDAKTATQAKSKPLISNPFRTGTIKAEKRNS